MEQMNHVCQTHPDISRIWLVSPSITYYVYKSREERELGEQRPEGEAEMHTQRPFYSREEEQTFLLLHFPPLDGAETWGDHFSQGSRWGVWQEPGRWEVGQGSSFPALVMHGVLRRPRAVYILFWGSTGEEALWLPNSLTLAPETSIWKVFHVDPSPSHVWPQLAGSGQPFKPFPPHCFGQHVPSASVIPDSASFPDRLLREALEAQRDPPESSYAPKMPQTKHWVTTHSLLSLKLWFQREDPRVWLREIVSPFSRWVVLRCGKIAGKVVGGPRAKYNVGIPGSAFRLSINPGLSLRPTPPTSTDCSQASGGECGNSATWSCPQPYREAQGGFSYFADEETVLQENRGLAT